MEPQANMAYCIKHREFVNGLLEGRGWQAGDRASDEERIGLIVNVPKGGGADVQWRSGAIAWQGSGLIWIPAEGDVLGMLEEEGVRPMLWRAVSGGWLARGYDKTHPVKTHEASGGKPTPLIALLELLRAVEGKG